MNPREAHSDSRLRLKPPQLEKLVQIAGDRRRRSETRHWAREQLEAAGYGIEALVALRADRLRRRRRLVREAAL